MMADCAQTGCRSVQAGAHPSSIICSLRSNKEGMEREQRAPQQVCNDFDQNYTQVSPFHLQQVFTYMQITICFNVLCTKTVTL
jgi:hypothetical protein